MKAGRPADTVVVRLGLPRHLVLRLDAAAAERALGRSRLAEWLLTDALDRLPAVPTRRPGSGPQVDSEPPKAPTGPQDPPDGPLRPSDPQQQPRERTHR